MLNKIWTSLSHNQSLFISVLVCTLLTLWCYSCVPTTKSPRDYTKKVTHEQLDIEVQTYASEVSLAYADLQKKELIRKAIIDAGLVYTTSGGISIVGLISTLSGIMGIGAVIDNRRKDAVINSKSNALLALSPQINNTT